jgi:hypothetical protein
MDGNLSKKDFKEIVIYSSLITVTYYAIKLLVLKFLSGTLS